VRDRKRGRMERERDYVKGENGERENKGGE